MEHLLRDKDFRIGFGAGVVLHVLMIVTRWKACFRGDCTSIVYWDIPVSILYYAFDSGKVLFASFLIGSIYWGFLFYGVLTLVKRFFGDGTR